MGKRFWIDKRPETVGDWLGIIFVSVLFYLLLHHLGEVFDGVARLMGHLAPFAGGVAIAYILDPIVRACQKNLFGGRAKLRWVSILLAYVCAGLLLGLLVWMVAPQVAASIGLLYNNIPGYIDAVQQTLATLQDTYGFDLSRAQEMLENWEDLVGRLYGMIPGVMGYLSDVASNSIAVFTALAASVYMLADKDHLLRQLRTIVHAFLPRRVADNVLRICGHANDNFSGFFIGKLIDSLIIGALTFVCMLVLRLDFAPLISVVVGITNIIPVFGPFIGAVPGVIILLFVDPLQALIFLALILVIQQLDGNFIGPKILGQSIGISALWVLFAIVLGGDLWGIVGMVLGVPVFATLYGLVRELVAWNLARRGLNEDGQPLPTVDEADDDQLRMEDLAGPGT